MDTMDQAYAALGLAPGASTEEVERAYRRAIRRYPPELNPRRFARIKQAHEMLGSYERRMEIASRDIRAAIDLLVPAAKPRLADPPQPPPSPTFADWEPLLGPLREQAVREVLAELAPETPTSGPSRRR